MNIRKPARLKKGDLVGVIAPASPVMDPAKIERGVRFLEALGYRTAVGRHVTATVGYLAGTDEQRLEDLHAMFRDRRVKAVFCVRGGYGTPRLLSRIDYRLIARNPKIFVGYSDLTALHLAFWKKCRLVTFHGPMVGVEMAAQPDPVTEEHFWSVLTSTRTPPSLSFPEKARPSPLHPGRASGRILGGNLSLLVSLIGTPYTPDFKGSLLALEEVGEEPYRVDRMLMQLIHASVLSSCSAVLTGQFTECVQEDPARPSSSVPEILQDLAFRLRKPFLANLPFGHADPKLTLPLGVRARVDTGEGCLELLEPAVE